jgi:8-oxo-dGTP pyrophosphatase MutT (NUDIX family)
MPSRWKRVKSGKKADYTVLQIREDIVRDPRNGEEHPRVVITCPDWVQVIPLTREGKVVMVRQYRVAIGAPTLEMPGGIVDRGEAPKTAAKRELDEETGYRPERILSLGSVHPNPALQVNRCHAFVALNCEKVHNGAPEAAEDLETVLVDPSALPGLVREGRISHALTVTGLYLWDHWGERTQRTR